MEKKSSFMTLNTFHVIAYWCELGGDVWIVHPYSLGVECKLFRLVEPKLKVLT